jgi:hypothetical protein
LINILDNDEISDLIDKYGENGDIDKLLDLNNIKDEITDGKIIKYEKMKEEETVKYSLGWGKILFMISDILLYEHRKNTTS